MENRRNFLRKGASAAGLALLSGTIPKALAATCGLTPPQTPGPFYPGEDQFPADSDLTLVAGRPTRAQGQIIYVKGTVTEESCRPVANANVEIWQACASGKYNNRKDPNPAPLDPNFQYWGEAFTDANGAYLFKSILPGSYPADQQWRRPPHIHFKVSCLGYRELITQMYFEGDPLNERDLILLDIPAAEREKVIVKFAPAPAGFEPGSLLGTFDLHLRKPGR